MALRPPMPTQNFSPVPEGSYPAVVYQVIDLGTQTTYYNDEPKQVHQVHLGFELPGERTDDDKPRVISGTYTLSIDPKSSLRPILHAIVGTTLTDKDAYELDFRSLLGRPCMVGVSHRKSKDGSKTYQRISGVQAFPKSFPPPSGELETVFYETEDGPPPETLPEWLRKKILESVEHSGGRSSGYEVDAPPAPTRPAESFDEFEGDDEDDSLRDLSEG